jgi:hypothetical protein
MRRTGISSSAPGSGGIVLAIVTRAQKTYATVVALCFLVFCSLGIAQMATAKPNPKQDATTLPMAKWDPLMGKYYSMSEQQFDEMGLSKLTADQFEKLRYVFLWREVEAGVEAQEDLLTTTPIAHCASVRANDKIRVFVSEPEKNEAEFSSALLRNLRAIPDVDLTYDEGSADLGVAALLNKSETTSGIVMGHTVAITTYNVCRIGQGANAYIGRLIANTLLYTSDTLGDLAGMAVATIDSKDLEEKRKLQSKIKSLHK